MAREEAAGYRETIFTRDGTQYLLHRSLGRQGPAEGTDAEVDGVDTRLLIEGELLTATNLLITLLLDVARDPIHHIGSNEGDDNSY